MHLQSWDRLGTGAKKQKLVVILVYQSETKNKYYNIVPLVEKRPALAIFTRTCAKRDWFITQKSGL